MEMLKVQPISYLPNNFIQTLFMAINTSINKVEFDGKECYILRIDDSEVFVEAETGLMIKKIDSYKDQKMLSPTTKKRIISSTLSTI